MAAAREGSSEWSLPLLSQRPLAQGRFAAAPVPINSDFKNKLTFAASHPSLALTLLKETISCCISTSCKHTERETHTKPILINVPDGVGLSKRQGAVADSGGYC